MAEDWQEEQKDAGMNDEGDDEEVDWGLDDSEDQNQYAMMIESNL